MGIPLAGLAGLSFLAGGGAKTMAAGAGINALGKLGGMALQAAPYIPALGSLMGGRPGEAAASAGSAALAGKFLPKGTSPGTAAAVQGVAGMVGGGVIPGVVGGLTTGVQNLVGGTANAAERANIIGPYGQRPGFTPSDIAQMGQMNQVQRQNALALNAGLQQQAEQFRDNELARSMRLNNQFYQGEAGLGAMKITGQLADRQIAEGGANFRQMVGMANPYAMNTTARVNI